MIAPEVREALAALDDARRASAEDAYRKALAELAAAAKSTPDGSGPVPPLNDPDPSPTPATFAVIVTLGEDLPAGTQLWVRRESWGELAVDERPTPGSSWLLGQFSGLTVEEAP